jgi:beta propeller repeat protein
MKNNTKLHSAALASAILILFIIIVSSTASAASPKITETRITFHKTASNPDIYGNNLVWQDNRNGNWDIYIYDLSTKKEIHTTNFANQTVPAIYGNKVVWEDERNGGHDVYMEDLSTKIQTRISKSGKAYNPAIYGNRIVWQDERNGKNNIYMYDISTKTETQISTSGSATKPDIYGNRIVFCDTDEYGEPNLAMYNISTHKEIIIGYTFLYMAAIYGDRIVIQTDPDNIAMYNLSTSTGTTIVPHDTEYDLAIYNDMVVYAYTDRQTIQEIDMYNVTTQEETKISTSETANNPKVFGNRIVWQDWRNGGQDIYMATILYPPVAAFTASPISGKKLLNVKFTDKSTGSITSMSWNFGDKTTSTLKSPVHKYTKAGKYTVSLTVKNAAGNNTKTMSNYITVK